MSLFSLGSATGMLFLTSLSKKLIRQLQLIQSSIRPGDWTTSLQFSDLYTGFKILILVYEVLNALGPKHISDLLLCYEPSRPLRSSGTGLLTVPRVKTKHREAAFSFYAPHIWNKPPENLKSARTLNSFKSGLFCLPLRKLNLGLFSYLDCNFCSI